MRAAAHRFPFPSLRSEGAKVKLLHRVGLCAVAHVQPAEPNRAPYFICAFRQHQAQAPTLAEVPAALRRLRELDNAEIRRENEVLTAAEALTQLDLTPACLEAFCALTGLNPAQSYQRRQVRRAIVSARPPKMAVYLALLSKLTPTTTNPA